MSGVGFARRGVVRDESARWPVVSSVTHFTGRIITVATEQVVMPSGDVVGRDVVRHPGAVGIVPYDEEDGEVLLLQQYRHAPAMLLWEPPAGIRDIAGETPLQTAQRELYEEAHLRAGRWNVLVDAFTSPGFCDETLRIYLARELGEVSEGERHSGEHEEANLVLAWVPLADVVRLILTGHLHNPTTIMGILALTAALSGPGHLAALRPA